MLAGSPLWLDDDLRWAQPLLYPPGYSQAHWLGAFSCRRVWPVSVLRCSRGFCLSQLPLSLSLSQVRGTVPGFSPLLIASHGRRAWDAGVDAPQAGDDDVGGAIPAGRGAPHRRTCLTDCFWLCRFRLGVRGPDSGDGVGLALLVGLRRDVRGVHGLTSRRLALWFVGDVVNSALASSLRARRGRQAGLRPGFRGPGLWLSGWTALERAFSLPAVSWLLALLLRLWPGHPGSGRRPP